ncbi:hypothetical protein [Photorhabdus asymbiotica]|uniref:hypothetical protein n=1 Tax=Photorhabdus asymbiotica TaxID=291112 RepID=UPI003DA71A34
MKNRMYLLDRNVVNLIKNVVAGKELTDKRKLYYVQFLRRIDTPMSYISPLLSIIEGECERENSAEEKAACQEKESEALRQFFSVANIDSDQLDASRDDCAACFTTYREGQWGAREVFFRQAVQFIATKVSKNKRSAIEQNLICAARSAGLSANDSLLILCLACLHGNDDARKVINPHCPNAYNVLNDLHVISRIGLIKAIAKQSGIPMITRFITMDQGLERVLSNVRIVETDLRDVHSVQMKLRYLPELFPELDHARYCALMTKLTS